MDWQKLYDQKPAIKKIADKGAVRDVIRYVLSSAHYEPDIVNHLIEESLLINETHQYLVDELGAVWNERDKRFENLSHEEYKKARNIVRRGIELAILGS